MHVHLADAGAAIEAGILAGRPSRIAVTYLGPAGAGPAARPGGEPAVSPGLPTPGLPTPGPKTPGPPDHGPAGSPGAGSDARPDGGPERGVVAVADGAGPAALLRRAGARVLRRDGGAGGWPGPTWSQRPGRRAGK